MSDQLIVNGNLVSWGSYVFGINGLTYTGITEISYGDKLEVTYGYGMGRSHAPIGRTAGKYVPDPLKIKVYQHTKDQIVSDLILTATDASIASIPAFPVHLQYLEAEFSHAIMFDACRITTITETISESADAMMAEIEMSIMGIYRDGYSLFRIDDSQI